ncbi:hypothetical protein BX600DRAFT_300735 [Xylariales sp. PMI_506]|nr:hypothetical protein BX600DRAFT_300735 [Xylariales sp. PMI_506]
MPAEEKAPTGKSTLGQRPPRPASSGLLKDFILESLSFKSMKNREEEVTEAHGDTFNWIFGSELSTTDDPAAPAHSFVDWLETDQLGPIYWITGKPGSGKSTLMRYIAEHDTTVRSLGLWAAGEQLARASFYFWTSGSEEQRSQTGLLRYLLHQLLSSDTDLIPKAFPDLWHKLSTMTTKERVALQLEWTGPELMGAFKLFLDNVANSTKVCLFIDGLDEFDGDHQEIIYFLKGLAERDGKARIKMCLSSRPWRVFEEAFEYCVPNLKLQELTTQDMSQYVRDGLRESANIKRQLEQNPEFEKTLSQAIVQQADGVFLWVRLVVRRILETLDSPTVQLGEIKEFAQSLPKDLEKLFDVLLFRSQTTEQLAESAQIFGLVRGREVVADFIKDESANSLTIWELAFALDELDDAPALDEEVREVEDNDILKRCTLARSRIITRSAGLLDVFSKHERKNPFVGSGLHGNLGLQARRLAENRVIYLHRTVRDYLVFVPQVWDRLSSFAPKDFDPHLRLLRSYVLRLKNPLEMIEHHRRLDEWYPDIALALTHARYITNDPTGFQTPLINELNKTISWYWLPRSGDPYDHWARACFGSYELRKGNKVIFPQPFLALCTKFGLERYVLDSLDALANEEPPTTEEDSDDDDDDDDDDYGESDGERAPPPPLPIESTPILAYALEFLTSRQKTIWPLSSFSFVSALLQSQHLQHPTVGPVIGGPNVAFDSVLSNRKGITPWIVVLRHLRDAKRRGWIDHFDVEQEGTERWTAVVKLLAQAGGADLEAVVKGDSWDPESSTKDVIMGEQQLGSIDDWWIYGLQDLFCPES